MNAIYVALGGAAGSLLRYYVGIWVTNATGARTPGTVLINVVGSFLIGLFLMLSVQRGWSSALVILISVGFLGGFTTFSTFTWQTYEHFRFGEPGAALLNVGFSLTAGTLAVWAGTEVARAMSH